MSDQAELTVGLFGVGLDTYWPQFEGLKTRLEGYLEEISGQIASVPGVALANAGLVDSPDRSREAAAFFAEKRVDLIFLYISTYALSSTVLPVVQELRVPVVLLNVQPGAAIDYDSFNALNDRGKMTGEWLGWCQACSVPEIASVFNRVGVGYHLVSGYLGDDRTENSIREWIDAAKVARTMKYNRLGILGHYYAGMLDVYTDVTRLIGSFGGHVELLEMDELASFRASVTDAEIEGKLAEFRATFAVAEECEREELMRAAKTSLALDKLVAAHRLGSLAYYYEGTAGSVHEDIITSVIVGNTMLTGKHVPVAGECEVKNAQAMKILDTFGAGGSFSEYYALDFNDDIVMLGHDGPGHAGIAEGVVCVVPLPVYHGKPGKGLSIQMSVRHGQVTVLSVCEGKDGPFMIVAEGECVPGPVLNIGNTNSRYRFPISAAEYIERWSTAGPSHHCAIGVGHIASRIEKLGKLMGVPVRRIA
jgi:L-arabinose isomerase